VDILSGRLNCACDYRRQDIVAELLKSRVGMGSNTPQTAAFLMVASGNMSGLVNLQMS